MAEEKKIEPEPSSRRPRRDGLRNRELLLDAARAAFTAGELDLRFDEFARRAGVGIGTLYRHFPNRDALIAAVYRAELEKLASAAKLLSEQLTPFEALREWMLLFVDYIATKQVIAPALNMLVEGGDDLRASAGPVLTEAMNGLVARVVATGEMRADIEPLDLLRALVGVSNASASPGWEASAKRLVDILLAGSRPGATTRSDATRND